MTLDTISDFQKVDFSHSGNVSILSLTLVQAHILHSHSDPPSNRRYQTICSLILQIHLRDTKVPPRGEHYHGICVGLDPQFVLCEHTTRAHSSIMPRMAQANYPRGKYFPLGRFRTSGASTATTIWTTMPSSRPFQPWISHLT